jgi:hypothetical protein
LILFSPLFFLGQSAPTADSTSKSLKVFLNCQTQCYGSYLKTEITWVYFVQDQFVADVNLRINSLTTGSGGQQYSLIFEGRKSLKGMNDTLSFTTASIATENEIREALARKVKLGLIRFAAKGNYAEHIVVHSTDQQDTDELGVGSNPEEDPFNAWVFVLGGSGNISGQQTYTTGNYYGSVTASQTKEKFKLKLYAMTNYSFNVYDYGSYTSDFRMKYSYASAKYVKSLNDHWSLGGVTNYYESSRDNYKSSVSGYVALEANVFPYKESQTRQLTASLYLGEFANVYNDTTIYFKTREYRPSGMYNINAVFNQSWGSLSLGVSGDAILNDFKKNSTNVYASVDARIYKGLSVSLYSSFSIIRNQINLPKDNASIEELLLQQQIVATNYSYYSYVSLNYRFGSIYNNVVNTRFSNEF